MAHRLVTQGQVFGPSGQSPSERKVMKYLIWPTVHPSIPFRNQAMVPVNP